MDPQSYRHLLLAVDFSNETEQVVKKGKELSRAFSARLSLVHVVEYVPIGYAGDLVLPDDYNLEQQLEEIAEKNLHALGDRLQIPKEDRHLPVGTTGPEILRVAEQQQVDLIIVGSHGRHGLALFLGSTASTILHHARCDVLAVRFRS